jgi:predicted  nucleic acid-binding Zn-ribbon protein
MGSYGNCCEPAGFNRRFSTRDERVERLKAYQEALETEVKAVRERIQDLTAS